MKIGICCIVKQENLYLRDWVKYYYDMGVTNIILYDNNDVNGEYPQQVIGDYISSGFVIYKDVRGKYRHQITAYECCYHEYIDYFDWIGFLDIDEYWYLSPELTFETFFSEERFPNGVAIFLNWLCYGDDGNVHYDNRPVTERFTHPSQPIDIKRNTVKKMFLKCNKNVPLEIIDANGVRFINPHDMENNFAYTVDGDFFRNEIKQVYKDSYVKHYVTLTIEEFLYRRFGRGGYADLESPHQKDYILNLFWDHNEWTEEKQAVIDEFFKHFTITEDIPTECPYL